MIGEKPPRRKNSYSLELWDRCGTSYGSFPFDPPLFMESARKTSSFLSSSGADVRRFTTVGHAQQRLRSASVECKIGLISDGRRR